MRSALPLCAARGGRSSSAKSPEMMLHALVLAVAAAPCASAQTQTDLNQCWAAQAAQADAQLNATYKKVRAGLRALGVNPDDIVPSELAWIVARDSTCAFEESLSEGGSISPMMGSQCVDRMTRARTQYLADLLDVLKAEGVIATLAPVDPAVDAELNRVYKLYMGRLDATQKKKLVQAETDWLRYRDKTCKVWGSDCLTVLEKERTAELEAGWLGERFW